jgi:uncharacterized protein (TIGR02246 family)
MRVLLGALVVALLSVGSTPIGSSRAQTLSAQDQVAAATDAWREAYDSRDPARIIALYDPEAVFWGTTSQTIRPTPDAIAEYFQDAGARPNARVTFGELYIRVYGDVAINSGDYTFTDVRDGNPVTTPARFSMVFANRDGTWLIVDHHSSRVP